MFKNNRKLNMSYEKQGLIYFICHNITIMSEKKDYIDKLCYHVAGEYAEPLYIALTTRNSVPYIAEQYYMSERNLYYYMHRFYKSWNFNWIEPKKVNQPVTRPCVSFFIGSEEIKKYDDVKKYKKPLKPTEQKKYTIKSRKGTKEKIALIAEVYKKEKRKKWIAKQLNMSYGTIKYFLSKYSKEIENG